MRDEPLYKAVGLMTGSSMDGVDAAILITDGVTRADFGGARFAPYTNSFRKQLYEGERVLGAHQGDLRAALANHPSLAETIQQLTEQHGALVEDLLKQIGLEPSNLDVIGFHGQNWYHAPHQKRTVQVGHAAYLARRLGCPVVHQFRLNDVLHGGQGAPFAPIYHLLLAHQTARYPLVVINCGGIANLTYIPGPDPMQLLGFDTGPGNVLLDRFVRLKTDGVLLMDEDGRLGAKGCLHQVALDALLERHASLLRRAPPKAFYSQDFVWDESLWTMSLEDGCRTLAAFTAQSIAAALDFLPPPYPRHYVLAGGGWKNPVICELLREAVRARVGEQVIVSLADEWGWRSQSLEAELMAYLAVRSLKGLPLSYPNTTQVPAPMTGGEWVYPPRKEAMLLDFAAAHKGS